MIHEKSHNGPALTQTSYWLMPEAGAGEFFGKFIAGLAGEFGGPVFAPHLTVSSGPGAKEDDPDSILKEAAGAGGGFLLKCTGLEFSAEYTKACVLNFRSEVRLDQLAEAIKTRAFHADDYRFVPHLSLFYGKLNRPEQERVRAMVEFPLTVRFDRLVVMATSTVIKTARDVQSWRQIVERPL